MKRFVFMLMMIVVLSLVVSPVSAESIRLEEALSLLAGWNQKAESVLLQKGWLFFQYRTQMNERFENYLLPFDYYNETWAHFEQDRLEDAEIAYCRSEKDGRQLLYVAVDGFSYSYKDATLYEKYNFPQFSTDFGFAEELRAKADFGPGYEIQIAEDSIGDTKAVRLETLTYFSSFEKKVIDDLYGLDTLGEYFRRWYDPESGFLLRVERYYMSEDRKLWDIFTVSEISYRRADELPESVQNDYERTRRREFEKTDSYKIVAPDGTISGKVEMDLIMAEATGDLCSSFARLLGNPVEPDIWINHVFWGVS